MTSHDIAIIAMVFIVTSVLSGILQGFWPLRDPHALRLARLEGKVNKILEHLGIEQVSDLDKVQELIVMGRRIQAIKLYREQTGASLKDAKDAVLSMEAQLKVAGLA